MSNSKDISSLKPKKRSVDKALSSEEIEIMCDLIVGPLDIPLPPEPVYVPNELLRLTYANQVNPRMNESSSQTDETEFIQFSTAYQEIKRLETRVDEFPKSLETALYVTNRRRELALRHATTSVHCLTQGRLNHLSKRYATSVEAVRGACRTHLANSIAILNGLLSGMRPDGTFDRTQLDKKILELEAKVQELCLEIHMLRLQIDDLTLERDQLLSQLELKVMTLPAATPVMEKAPQTDHGVQMKPTQKNLSVQQTFSFDNEEVPRLKDLIETLRKKLAECMQALEDSRQQCQLLEEQLKAALAENERLKSTVAKLQRQLNKALYERDQARERLKAAEKRISELNELMAKLNDASKLENKNAELQREIDRLKLLNANLMAENKRLLNELNKQQENRAQPTTETNNAALIREQALLAEIARLRYQLTRTIETASARVGQLKHRLKAAKEEVFSREAREQQVALMHKVSVAYADQHRPEFLLTRQPVDDMVAFPTKHYSPRRVYSTSSAIELPPINQNRLE